MHVTVTPEAASVQEKPRCRTERVAPTVHGQEVLHLRLSPEAASVVWKHVRQGLGPPEATMV